MSAPTIVSVNEQAAYSVKRSGLLRSDMQEFFVDVGGTFPRSQVVPLLMNSSRLPQPFQPYPLNPVMYSGPITYVQMKDVPNVWIVSVQWDTITNIQQTIKDPTKRPALISTGTYKQVENPDVDFDNKPLATTAGEPIDFSYNRSYPTYTIQKALADYPTEFGLDRDFVNSDTVKIYGIKYPPYTLFMPDVTISYLQWEGNYPFYAFEATIYVSGKKDSSGNIIGWRNIKRNAGYHEKVIVGWQARKNLAYAINTVGQLTVASYVGVGPILQLLPGAGPTGNLTLQVGRNTIRIPEAVLGSQIQGGQSSSFYYPIYGLKAIALGTSGRYTYPSSPVLLNPNGQAYREQLATDPSDGTNNTGPVLGLRANGDSITTAGITPKQWEAAIVEGRLYNFVPFTSLLDFAVTDFSQSTPPNLGFSGTDFSTDQNIGPIT